MDVFFSDPTLLAYRMAVFHPVDTFTCLDHFRSSMFYIICIDKKVTGIALESFPLFELKTRICHICEICKMDDRRQILLVNNEDLLQGLVHCKAPILVKILTSCEVKVGVHVLDSVQILIQ